MTTEPGTPSAVVELTSLPWEEEAPGIQSRSAELGDARYAIVRYAPGAERDEWCTVGHHGYVLEGHISYELIGGGRVEATLGTGFWLPPGLGHRGVNGDHQTTLFLVDVEVQGAGER